MTAKKQTEKKQEPESEEQYKPMAAPEPDPIERLEAVEIRLKELEKQVSQHNRYHFGGTTG